ncbi:MAG: hypothetical protein JW881_18740 [Spirochaetales bacterium]|nr:hypothetical protein [Spirochaetales bacterium]
MKTWYAVLSLLVILALIPVHAKTIKQKGLEISVSHAPSCIDGIVNFTVRVKNTTSLDKTLTATIYLFPDGTQKHITDETPRSPVYLEIPKKQHVEDTFFLFYPDPIQGATWELRVDEIYDFILSNDNGDEAGGFVEKEGKESVMNPVIGTWKMTARKKSRVSGEWTWSFREDGSVVIEEILGPEARMPVTYEGRYSIDGLSVSVDLGSGSPFPRRLKIDGDRLVSGNDVLIRIDGPGLSE